MLKKYNPVVRLVVFLSDSIILFLCWVFTYFLRFKTNLVPQLYPSVPDFSTHLLYSPYIIIIYFLVFYRLGLYLPLRICKIKDQFFVILRASIIAVIVFTAFLYFIIINGYHYSRATLVIFLFLSIIVLFILRCIILSSLRWLRRKGFNLKHVLIVGSGSQAKLIAERLSTHLDFGYNIIGFLVRENKDIGKEVVKGVKAIGIYDDLLTLTQVGGLDQIIFCMKANEERLIRPLLNRIDNEGVDVKVILELGDVFTIRSRAEVIDGLIILSLRENPLFGWQSMAKRIIDLIFSVFCLIVLTPFMVLIAIGIKITSKGPVFYCQERIGMDGRRFVIYKFRSMVDAAEYGSGAVFACKGDPRITKFGRLLRRYSLDELPQLFNVLTGDLSLVGPRPERPEFVSEFYKKIPRYMLRHKIRMGMTGWAQVNGLRGDARIKERLEYDLYYIEHWSFWFDLKIIVLTFFSIFKKQGVY